MATAPTGVGAPHPPPLGPRHRAAVLHAARSGPTRIDVYGPAQADGPLGEVFAEVMWPPYFPITPAQLGGNVRSTTPATTTSRVGSAKVRSRWVRHIDPALGFRVELEGRSVDLHLRPRPGLRPRRRRRLRPDEVLELCDGVDVLIHDAQHTKAEYEIKRHFGHSTIEYAVHVAQGGGSADARAVPPLPDALRPRPRRDPRRTHASSRRPPTGPRSSPRTRA